MPIPISTIFKVGKFTLPFLKDLRGKMWNKPKEPTYTITEVKQACKGIVYTRNWRKIEKRLTETKK